MGVRKCQGPFSLSSHTEPQLRLLDKGDCVGKRTMREEGLGDGAA